MLIYSQLDRRWRYVQLGWGPPGSTIGAYGCLLTCLAMVAYDAYRDMHYTPATLDRVLADGHIFQRDAGGDFDLLPGNALDLKWPTRFRTMHFDGYSAATVAAAVNSKAAYAVLWISTPAVPTHFVVAYSADGRLIADPSSGRVASLSAYGGSSAVKAVFVIHKTLPPPKPVVIPPWPKPIPVPPLPTPPPPAPAPIPVPLPTPLPAVTPTPGFQDWLVWALNLLLKLIGRR
jgi:hypothetical protein